MFAARGTDNNRYNAADMSTFFGTAKRPRRIDDDRQTHNDNRYVD